MVNDQAYLEIRGYVEDVFALVDQYLQSLSDYTVPFINLEKVRREEDGGSRIKALLIIGQYGSKEALEKEKDRCLTKIKAAQKKLNDKIALMRSALEKGVTKCSMCNGVGKKYVARYSREDGAVASYLDSEGCPNCSGMGTYELSLQSRDYLAHSLKVVDKVKELGIIFLQTINDSTGSAGLCIDKDIP
jgi:hypothetical protein